MFQEELEAGCKRFGLSLGVVSHIQNNIYRIKYLVGKVDNFRINDEFPLEALYCKHIYRKKQTLAFHDITEPSGKLLHPLYDAVQLQSYISTPLIINSLIYGTLNFSSFEKKDSEFVPEDISFIEELAQKVQIKLIDEMRQSV